jgi:hypothetical protein
MPTPSAMKTRSMELAPSYFNDFVEFMRRIDKF